MKRTSMGCLVGIALFWWAISGTFAGIILAGILRHVDAQRRFRASDGIVISSRVESHRGRKSTLYAPALRYRYTVKNREYVGDRYTFDDSNSSDSGFADEIVAAHPIGRTVTVYYDPDHPERAILSLPIPNVLWAEFLFVQPFLTIGLGLLLAIATRPSQARRLERFLASPPSLPWEIPGWGRMEGGASGWSVRPRPRRIASIGGAYVLTSFLAAVVVIIAGHGFSNPPGWLLAAGYGTALGSAVVLGLRLSAGRTVGFDPSAGTLTVATRKSVRSLGMNAIEAFVVRVPVRVVTRRGGSGTEPGDPEIVAVLRGGETVVLNRFVSTWEAETVARKTAEEVARLAGRPYRT